MKHLVFVISGLIWLTSLLMYTSLISNANTNGNNYYAVLAESRYAVDKSSKNTESMSSEPKALTENIDKEPEEEINPAQIYKLIAVYIVGKQPRALIRNDLVPEDGPMEYRVGDYLDDAQTVSITRISLSPTTRIELIDNRGLTYLMKPYTIDTANSPASGSKFTGAGAFPTYSSSSKKSTSSSTASTSTPPVSTTPSPDTSSTSTPSSTSDAASVPPSSGSDESKKQEPAIKASATESTPESTSKPEEKAASQEPSSPSGTSTDASGGSGLDFSRPANPFDSN